MATRLVPVIRTGVQALVGLAFAYLIAHHLPLQGVDQGVVVVALTGVISGLVAKGQQWLEARYPWLGKLLSTPTYPSQ